MFISDENVIGVECFSLTYSPISSDDGHNIIIIVCPSTTITLTCTANQVGSMTWRYQGLFHIFLSRHIDNEWTKVVHDDPYTLTLIAVDNITQDGITGDFTSTLEVLVDDIDNVTDITCETFQNNDHIIIYIPGEYNTTLRQ